MKAWILKNKDTGQYMLPLRYGNVEFTDDISKARIFRRQCDAGNSAYYWGSSYYSYYRKKGFNLEKVEVTLDISINITK